MTREAMEAMGVKTLEQEPCEDAIDRAEAMTEIMMFAGNAKPDEEDIYIKVSDAVQLLRELPSVTPQQKRGRWIPYEVRLPDRIILNYRCSVCGRKLIGYSTETLSEAPFCHCGAKMQEEGKMTLRTKGEQKAYLDGYEMCAKCIKKYLTAEGKQRLDQLLFAVRTAITIEDIEPQEGEDDKT